MLKWNWDILCDDHEVSSFILPEQILSNFLFYKFFTDLNFALFAIEKSHHAFQNRKKKFPPTPPVCLRYDELLSEWDRRGSNRRFHWLIWSVSCASISDISYRLRKQSDDWYFLHFYFCSLSLRFPRLAFYFLPIYHFFILLPYLLLSSFITLQPFRFKCSCVDCALLLRSVESLLLLPFSSISSSFPFVFLITSFQLSDCLSECEYHPSFSRLYASESASASFHRSWQTSTECNMIWLSFYQWLGKNHFYINAECAEKAGSQFLEPTWLLTISGLSSFIWQIQYMFNWFFFHRNW